MKRAVRSMVLGVVVCVACGGDDGASTRSGVDGDKKLAELSQTELVKMCKWEISLVARFGATEEELCTLDASDTEDPAVCREVRDECLDDGWYAEDVEEIDPDEVCEGGEIERVEPRCQATVAQYERCYEDLLRAYDDAAQARTCDAPGAGEADIPIPKSCDEGNIFVDCLLDEPT